MKRLKRLAYLLPWLIALVVGVLTLRGFDQATPEANALEGRSIFSFWSEKKMEDPITIMFTGDIMLDRYIATLREKNGGTFPFTHMPEVITAVEDALEVDHLDLIAGNVEGPISDSSYKNNGTAMRFNFKPETAQQLADVGFTTANLANNHTLDQGLDAYQQSHDYLEAAGIRSFGHPTDPNSQYSFIRYDFDGSTVGFLGFNDAVTHLDYDDALAKIDEVAPSVDTLIIAIHWGIEYEPTARKSIQEFAHQMVDHGVDFIWGTHPHVVQNHETYNGAPIYYSLGNFVFDQYWSKATQKGLVLGLKIVNGEMTVVEIPVDLVNQGEPRPSTLNAEPHNL